MVVGKNTENVINNKLLVDSWESRYVTDGEEIKLVENHTGLVELGQTDKKHILDLSYRTKVTIWLIPSK